MPDNLTRIKAFLLVIAFCLISCRLLADEAPSFQGETTVNGINIRADSTVGAEIISTLRKGERVEVVSELYDWYKIRLPKESPAHIKKILLECTNFKITEINTGSPEAGQLKECISAKVARERVNVRLQPSETSSIIGKAVRGEVVSVVVDGPEWDKIVPTANSYGWINKKFLRKVEVIPEIKEVASVSLPVNLGADITVEGLINPFGRILNSVATHKLVTADNKIYLLKADKKKLNALNHRKAIVTGKIIESRGQKDPLIEIISIEEVK